MSKHEQTIVRANVLVRFRAKPFLSAAVFMDLTMSSGVKTRSSAIRRSAPFFCHHKNWQFITPFCPLVSRPGRFPPALEWEYERLLAVLGGLVHSLTESHPWRPIKSCRRALSPDGTGRQKWYG